MGALAKFRYLQKRVDKRGMANYDSSLGGKFIAKIIGIKRVGGKWKQDAPRDCRERYRTEQWSRPAAAGDGEIRRISHCGSLGEPPLPLSGKL